MADELLVNLLNVARSQAGFFTEKQAHELGYPLNKLSQSGIAWQRWDGAICRFDGYSDHILPEFVLIHFSYLDSTGWPATAFSHESALLLHGLIQCSPDRLRIRKLAGSVIRHSQRLQTLVIGQQRVDPEKVVNIDGVLVTDFAETLRDVATSVECGEFLDEVAPFAARSGQLGPELLDKLSKTVRETVERAAGVQRRSLPRTEKDCLLRRRD